MPDVLVIGGGPSGSLTALLLARAGRQVLLLEQCRFPRDKVCGECLSALGIDVLRRAGLNVRIERASPVILTRALVHLADGPTLEVTLRRPMWGLTRRCLDQALLDAAREAGVRVEQPARVERVTPGGARSLVTWRRLTDNQQRSATVDWLVVADGKGAFPFAAPRPTGDLGVKAHFANVVGPSDAIELFAGPSCYGGLAPVEDGSWNAAFAIPAALLRQYGGQVDAVINHARGFNPSLARRLKNSTRVGPWLSAPLPRHSVRRDAPAGVIYVGNSAAALEPVGGEGMGLALRSAELAANAIISGMGATGKLATDYGRLWTLKRTICRAIGWAAARPSVAPAIGHLAAADDRLVTRIAAMAGK